MRAAGADGAAQPIVVSMVRVIKLAADGDGDDGDGGGGAGSVDPRTIGLIFVLTVLAVALAAGVVALLRHKHTRFGVSRPGTPSPARARSQQAGHEVMMPTRSGPIQTRAVVQPSQAPRPNPFCAPPSQAATPNPFFDAPPETSKLAYGRV